MPEYQLQPLKAPNLDPGSAFYNIMLVSTLIWCFKHRPSMPPREMEKGSDYHSWTFSNGKRLILSATCLDEPVQQYAVILLTPIRF